MRASGKIVCNLHLHKYYSRAFGVNCFDIEVHTDAACEFWSELSDKMRYFIKQLLDREEIWNYGFTICAR